MLWVAFVLVLSAVVGWLRGGRLKNLTDVRASAWWLLLVGLVMQLVAGLLPASLSEASIVLVQASAIPILAMIWINRSAPGMWIAGLGILMNFTVIAVNQGMPVLPQAVEIAGGASNPVLDGRHIPMTSATRLPFLGDLIPLPGSVISLGDVLLAVGLGVFIEEEMRRKPRLFRRGVRGEAGSAAER